MNSKWYSCNLFIFLHDICVWCMLIVFVVCQWVFFCDVWAVLRSCLCLLLWWFGCFSLLLWRLGCAVFYANLLRLPHFRRAVTPPCGQGLLAHVSRTQAAQLHACVLSALSRLYRRRVLLAGAKPPTRARRVRHRMGETAALSALKADVTGTRRERDAITELPLTRGVEQHELPRHDVYTRVKQGCLWGSLKGGGLIWLTSNEDVRRCVKRISIWGKFDWCLIHAHDDVKSQFK